MATQKIEDPDAVIMEFVKQLPIELRLKGLTSEEILATLTPEQRLALLTPEQIVRAMGPEWLLPAMPEEVLQAFSAEFIDKLPEPTRSAVRKRLGR